MSAIADVTGKSIPELLSLGGRNAVVTGGGRGLGKAIALRLAEAGANVIIGDREADLAKQASNDISDRFGINTMGMYLDVSKTESIKMLVEQAVIKLGSIDIWVNNAGVFPCVSLEDMTDELWDDVLAINARGTFACSREAARCMTEADKGGVIVNVASTAAFRGIMPGLSAYVASK